MWQCKEKHNLILVINQNNTLSKTDNRTKIYLINSWPYCHSHNSRAIK